MNTVSAVMTLEHIYLSTGHAFFGRHGQGAADHPMIEASEVECVEGMGLKGDRFFGYKPGYKGQVTLFSAEVWDSLCNAFPGTTAQPSLTRRNLLVRGADLNALVGHEFELQGIKLQGIEECRPCYWMDKTFGTGAEAWLRGRGGLRCRILTSGTLRINEA